MKKVIVYNMFSLDALFAAAYWETQRRVNIVEKSDEKIVIFDNTKNIPLDGDEYLWLGIDPKFKQGNYFYELRGRNNVSLNSIESKDEGVKYHMTITDQTAVTIHSMVIGTKIGRLTSLIARFHDKNLTKEELTFLYVNIRNAEAALAGGPAFNVIEPTDTDEVEFFKYLKRVKGRLNNSFKVEFIECKQKYFRTIVTSLVDDYHWALRLIKLAHTNHANIAITPIGCIIDTNLTDIKKFVLDFDVMTSKSY